MAEQEVNLTQMRDNECVPIARELLRIIAAHADELPIGSSPTRDELIEAYSKFYNEHVGAFLISTDMKVDNVAFIFSIMLQMVQLVQERVTLTVEDRVNKADAIKWGIADMSELRISDVQKVFETE